MIRPLFYCAAALFLCALSIVRAEDARTVFETANRLYYEGKFQQSASLLESLVTHGSSSAEIFYNLGNALYKDGHIGRAVVAYRQAASLKPRDPDIQANLQFARRQAGGPPLDRSAAARAINRMTANEWTIVFSIFFWTLFASLALKQLRSWRGPPLRWLFLVLTIGALIAGGGLAVAFDSQHLSKAAVIITSSAPVRQGPHESAQAVFTAHDGAELPLLDRKEEWLLVRIDRDRLGWLNRKSAVISPGNSF